MFSKALFKQSCKANGTMWLIITCAVCFMLACVMLISGNGTIGDVKDSIQSTIINKEIDSELQKRSLNYYNNALDGTVEFDKSFANSVTDTLTYLVWLNSEPQRSDYNDDSSYNVAHSFWALNNPTNKINTIAGKDYIKSHLAWQSKKPTKTTDMSDEEYNKLLEEWKKQSPLTEENAVTVAYTYALNDVQEYVLQKLQKQDESTTKDSLLYQEILGVVLYDINPNGMFNDKYTEHNEKVPSEYDIMSIINHLSTSDLTEYLVSDERKTYLKNRAENTAIFFIADNMTQVANVDKLLDALASYGITKERFDEFGYTYEKITDLATTTVITYRTRIEYIEKDLKELLTEGKITEEEYNKSLDEKNQSLVSEITGSLLSALPEKVSGALKEVGQMDLYTMIVGSIFYKLAGLLLPIIYLIMASNNLIAGQVDSGSMAYVLSTSTKRKTIIFTQAVYLAGSLLAMVGLMTVTSCVCLAIIHSEVGLTFGKLILLNLGAYLVLLALSGLCFLTSCYFDRSKRSMAIGGGLSIFSLVASMLGLFGSEVMPSVIRLDALNYFNYTTIITLFDVMSIMDGTNAFIWKFIILLVLGGVGYVLGAIKFNKKDLPL